MLTVNMQILPWQSICKYVDSQYANATLAAKHETMEDVSKMEAQVRNAGRHLAMIRVAIGPHFEARTRPDIYF